MARAVHVDLVVEHEHRCLEPVGSQPVTAQRALAEDPLTQMFKLDCAGEPVDNCVEKPQREGHPEDRKKARVPIIQAPRASSSQNGQHTGWGEGRGGATAAFSATPTIHASTIHASTINTAAAAIRLKDCRAVAADGYCCISGSNAIGGSRVDCSAGPQVYRGSKERLNPAPLDHGIQRRAHRKVQRDFQLGPTHPRRLQRHGL
mmetsp:Transcript_61886/g.124098  ORF Transcript_61886/g.124098 Transcript_61886/m.124098 type:complete len:204 (-) Transcript_61886:527-1138(-)